jgi:hypothetical protein
MEGETTESKEHLRCEHVDRENSTCRHGHFKGKIKRSDSKKENKQVPWLYNNSGGKTTFTAHRYSGKLGALLVNITVMVMLHWKKEYRN